VLYLGFVVNYYYVNRIIIARAINATSILISLYDYRSIGAYHILLSN